MQKHRENGAALVAALRDPGFEIAATQCDEIVADKDFVQLRDGQFDIELVFAPGGIERFEDACDRYVEMEGFPVCSMDDVHRKQGGVQPRQGS